MISVDLVEIGWSGRAWLLLMVFNVSVLIVALLRKPCRRLFGPVRAFQLWLVLPLAMAASQLPHANETTAGATSSLVYLIASAAANMPGYLVGSRQDEATDWIIWLWLAGSVCSLAHGGWAQFRYQRRLRDAVPIPGTESRWPVPRE